MKKAIRFIFAFALMAVLVLAMTSCVSGTVADRGTASIVVEAPEGHNVYTVDLSALEKRDEGAISVLEYLAMQEGSTLYYNLQWGGGYGAYITAIDSLDPDPSCEYISIYTSESEDYAVPSEWTPVVPTVLYNGMTLTYSGVGLSGMHVNDGTVIYIRLESFA